MKEHFNFAYTSDLLIFGINSQAENNIRFLSKKYLSILLVKRTKEPFKDKWCLPGGFILNDETSKEATERILKKETGLNKVYLEQVKVHDELNRDPRGRVISLSYMALIDRTLIKDGLIFLLLKKIIILKLFLLMAKISSNIKLKEKQLIKNHNNIVMKHHQTIYLLIMTNLLLKV